MVRRAAGGGGRPTSWRCWSSAAAEVVPRLDRTTDEIARVLHALDGGYVPAGPSGSPTRGLVNVLPTGRNFYSVDPKAIPSRSAWEVGSALADSLLARHLADTGSTRAASGSPCGARRAMRTQGDDLAEILALIGCRPVWDEASRRVTGFEVVPARASSAGRASTSRCASPGSSATRSRTSSRCSTTRSGRSPSSTSRPSRTTCAPTSRQDAAAHGDRRRATSRIFGSKPGAYGAGLLPLIDARNWRSDADLAEVYAVWGGYAYGRGLDGREARADMEQSFRRIAVAAKNQDTREHDIVDSDDYFQYHGGMVAMVRALTGRSPGRVRRRLRGARRGADPHAGRGDQAGVPGPGGQPEVDRGDAAPRLQGRVRAGRHRGLPVRLRRDGRAWSTTGCTTSSPRATCSTRPTAQFMEQSNPWALRGITERLLEAADRGMWAKPDDAVLDRLRRTYLDLEGDLEGEPAVNGTLVGVGVGPGDPELVTVRAADLLAKADVVFVPGRRLRGDRPRRADRAATTPRRGGSSGWCSRSARPRARPQRREQAWDAAAAQVAALVRRTPRRHRGVRHHRRPVRLLDVQLPGRVGPGRWSASWTCSWCPGITAMQDLAARSGHPAGRGPRGARAVPDDRGRRRGSARRWTAATPWSPTSSAGCCPRRSPCCARPAGWTRRCTAPGWACPSEDIRPAAELDPDEPGPYLSTLIVPPARRTGRGRGLR